MEGPKTSLATVTRSSDIAQKKRISEPSDRYKQPSASNRNVFSSPSSSRSRSVTSRSSRRESPRPAKKRVRRYRSPSDSSLDSLTESSSESSSGSSSRSSLRSSRSSSVYSSPTHSFHSSKNTPDVRQSCDKTKKIDRNPIINQKSKTETPRKSKSSTKEPKFVPNKRRIDVAGSTISKGKGRTEPVPSTSYVKNKSRCSSIARETAVRNQQKRCGKDEEPVTDVSFETYNRKVEDKLDDNIESHMREIRQLDEDNGESKKLSCDSSEKIQIQMISLLEDEIDDNGEEPLPNEREDKSRFSSHASEGRRGSNEISNRLYSVTRAQAPITSSQPKDVRRNEAKPRSYCHCSAPGCELSTPWVKMHEPRLRRRELDVKIFGPFHLRNLDNYSHERRVEEGSLDHQGGVGGNDSLNSGMEDICLLLNDFTKVMGFNADYISQSEWRTKSMFEQYLDQSNLFERDDIRDYWSYTEREDESPDAEERVEMNREEDHKRSSFASPQFDEWESDIESRKRDVVSRSKSSGNRREKDYRSLESERRSRSSSVEELRSNETHVFKEPLLKSPGISRGRISSTDSESISNDKDSLHYLNKLRELRDFDKSPSAEREKLVRTCPAFEALVDDDGRADDVSSDESLSSTVVDQTMAMNRADRINMTKGPEIGLRDEVRVIRKRSISSESEEERAKRVKTLSHDKGIGEKRLKRVSVADVVLALNKKLNSGVEDLPESESREKEIEKRVVKIVKLDRRVEVERRMGKAREGEEGEKEVTVRKEKSIRKKKSVRKEETIGKEEKGGKKTGGKEEGEITESDISLTSESVSEGKNGFVSNSDTTAKSSVNTMTSDVEKERDANSNKAMLPPVQGPSMPSKNCGRNVSAKWSESTTKSRERLNALIRRRLANLSDDDSKKMAISAEKPADDECGDQVDVEAVSVSADKRDESGDQDNAEAVDVARTVSAGSSAMSLMSLNLNRYFGTRSNKRVAQKHRHPEQGPSGFTRSPPMAQSIYGNDVYVAATERVNEMLRQAWGYDVAQPYCYSEAAKNVEQDGTVTTSAFQAVPNNPWQHPKGKVDGTSMVSSACEETKETIVMDDHESEEESPSVSALVQYLSSDDEGNSSKDGAEGKSLLSKAINEWNRIKGTVGISSEGEPIAEGKKQNEGPMIEDDNSVQPKPCPKTPSSLPSQSEISGNDGGEAVVVIHSMNVEVKSSSSADSFMSATGSGNSEPSFISEVQYLVDADEDLSQGETVRQQEVIDTRMTHNQLESAFAHSNTDDKTEPLNDYVCEAPEKVDLLKSAQNTNNCKRDQSKVAEENVGKANQSTSETHAGENVFSKANRAGQLTGAVEIVGKTVPSSSAASNSAVGVKEPQPQKLEAVVTQKDDRSQIKPSQSLSGVMRTDPSMANSWTLPRGSNSHHGMSGAPRHQFIYEGVLGPLPANARFMGHGAYPRHFIQRPVLAPHALYHLSHRPRALGSRFQQYARFPNFTDWHQGREFPR